MLLGLGRCSDGEVQLEMDICDARTDRFERDWVFFVLEITIVAYAGLGFLLSWTTMRLRVTVLGSLGVLLVIMTYGMVDEWTQNLVPTRTMEVGDWFADAVGGLAGLISYFFTQWLYLYLLMPARPVANPH